MHAASSRCPSQPNSLVRWACVSHDVPACLAADPPFAPFTVC